MAVVLFSGGCDSTLVLYNLAMQMARGQNGDRQRIIALSINHDQIAAGPKLHYVREQIEHEFRKRELTSDINFIELSIKHNLTNGVTGHGGVTHPIIWLSIAAMYCRDKDSIYLGYHTGDDYWMYKHEAETAFLNMAKVMDKNQVTIEYPLRGYHKPEIITELKAKGLYDLCWYCESEANVLTTKPCGTCYPCKCHQTALLQIEKGLDKDSISLNIPPFVKDCIKEQSKQIIDPCSCSPSDINMVGS